jgi:hypothetical protein
MLVSHPRSRRRETERESHYGRSSRRFRRRRSEGALGSSVKSPAQEEGIVVIVSQGSLTFCVAQTA